MGPLIIIGPVLLVAGACLLFCSCEICTRSKLNMKWSLWENFVLTLCVCVIGFPSPNILLCLFSRKYLRPGYGNKRRESWIQACSKPKTYTRSNIGLSQVRTYVSIIRLEIFCIKLHWILSSTFQSSTKFSGWIFLHNDFVFRTGQLWLGPMELRRGGQVTISLPPISNQTF